MALTSLGGPSRREMPGHTGLHQCIMHGRAQQTGTGIHVGDLQERSTLKVNDLREPPSHRRKGVVLARLSPTSPRDMPH
jgi:hypothetical protein